MFAVARILAFLWALVLAPSAFAGSAEPWRYLFLVDTSIAMEPKQSATAAIVEGLALTSFENQIKEGDLVELWPYNAPGETNVMEPIIWSPEMREQAANQLGTYLRNRRYRGVADYAELGADLKALLATAPNMFVFLLTDAHTPIRGLPFDVELNTEFGRIREQLRLASSPGLALLKVTKGHPTDWRFFGENPVATISAGEPDSAPTAQTALPEAIEPLVTLPVEAVPATHESPTAEALASLEPAPTPPLGAIPPAESQPLEALTQVQVAEGEVAVQAPAVASEVTEAAPEPSEPPSTEASVAAVEPPSVEPALAPATDEPAKADVPAKVMVAETQAVDASLPQKEFETAPSPDPLSAPQDQPTRVKPLLWAGGIGLGCVAIGGFLVIRRKSNSASQSLISRSISAQKPRY